MSTSNYNFQKCKYLKFYLMKRTWRTLNLKCHSTATIWYQNHKDVTVIMAVTEVAWPVEKCPIFRVRKPCIQMLARALNSCVTPGSLQNLSELQLLHLQNENRHAYLRKLLWKFKEKLYKKHMTGHHQCPVRNVCYCFQPFAHLFIYSLWGKQKVSILAGALTTQGFGHQGLWLLQELCRWERVWETVRQQKCGTYVSSLTSE